MKALVGAFNQEKALVGAFSVIVQLHWLIVYSTCPGASISASQLTQTCPRVYTGQWSLVPVVSELPRTHRRLPRGVTTVQSGVRCTVYSTARYSAARRNMFSVLVAAAGRACVLAPWFDIVMVVQWTTSLNHSMNMLQVIFLKVLEKWGQEPRITQQWNLSYFYQFSYWKLLKVKHFRTFSRGRENYCETKDNNCFTITVMPSIIIWF